MPLSRKKVSAAKRSARAGAANTTDPRKASADNAQAPLTPSLSPRAGGGRDPWRIRDAPPDRRTHASAERGGRVRGSGRRIWADLPRRTPFYIFTAFVFTYGTTVLHSSRDLLLVRDGPAFRVSLGSHRAQADVPLWRGHDGGVRLCLLRAVEHRSPGLDFSRRRAVARPAR